MGLQKNFSWTVVYYYTKFLQINIFSIVIYNINLLAIIIIAPIRIFFIILMDEKTLCIARSSTK